MPQVDTLPRVGVSFLGVEGSSKDETANVAGLLRDFADEVIADRSIADKGEHHRIDGPGIGIPVKGGWDSSDSTSGTGNPDGEGGPVGGIGSVGGGDLQNQLAARKKCKFPSPPPYEKLNAIVQEAMRDVDAMGSWQRIFAAAIAGSLTVVADDNTPADKVSLMLRVHIVPVTDYEAVPEWCCTWWLHKISITFQPFIKTKGGRQATRAEIQDALTASAGSVRDKVEGAKKSAKEQIEKVGQNLLGHENKSYCPTDPLKFDSWTVKLADIELGGGKDNQISGAGCVIEQIVLANEMSRNSPDPYYNDPVIETYATSQVQLRQVISAVEASQLKPESQMSFYDGRWHETLHSQILAAEMPTTGSVLASLVESPPAKGPALPASLALANPLVVEDLESLKRIESPLNTALVCAKTELFPKLSESGTGSSPGAPSNQDDDDGQVDGTPLDGLVQYRLGIEYQERLTSFRDTCCVPVYMGAIVTLKARILIDTTKCTPERCRELRNVALRMCKMYLEKELVPIQLLESRVKRMRLGHFYYPRRDGGQCEWQAENGTRPYAFERQGILAEREAKTCGCDKLVVSPADGLVLRGAAGFEQEEDPITKQAKLEFWFARPEAFQEAKVSVEMRLAAGGNQPQAIRLVSDDKLLSVNQNSSIRDCSKHRTATEDVRLSQTGQDKLTELIRTEVVAAWMQMENSPLGEVDSVFAAKPFLPEPIELEAVLGMEIRDTTSTRSGQICTAKTVPSVAEFMTSRVAALYRTTGIVVSGTPRMRSNKVLITDNILWRGKDGQLNPSPKQDRLDACIYLLGAPADKWSGGLLKARVSSLKGLLQFCRGGEEAFQSSLEIASPGHSGGAFPPLMIRIEATASGIESLRDQARTTISTVFGSGALSETAEVEDVLVLESWDGGAFRETDRKAMKIATGPCVCSSFEAKDVRIKLDIDSLFEEIPEDEAVEDGTNGAGESQSGQANGAEAGDETIEGESGGVQGRGKRLRLTTKEPKYELLGGEVVLATTGVDLIATMNTGALTPTAAVSKKEILLDLTTVGEIAGPNGFPPMAAEIRHWVDGAPAKENAVGAFANVIETAQPCKEPFRAGLVATEAAVNHLWQQWKDGVSEDPEIELSLSASVDETHCATAKGKVRFEECSYDTSSEILQFLQSKCATAVEIQTQGEYDVKLTENKPKVSGQSASTKIDFNFSLSLSLVKLLFPGGCCAVYPFKCVATLRSVEVRYGKGFKLPKDVRRWLTKIVEDESHLIESKALGNLGVSSMEFGKKYVGLPELAKVFGPEDHEACEKASMPIDQELEWVFEAESCSDELVTINVRDYFQFVKRASLGLGFWDGPRTAAFVAQFVANALLHIPTAELAVDRQPTGSEIRETGCCDPCCYFIWVHGIRVGPVEAVSGAGKVSQHLVDAANEYSNVAAPTLSNCKVINFSWPTNELVFDPYFGDMIQLANWSSAFLAQVILALREQCPESPVFLGSHSLGGRVLLGALKRLKATGAANVPFAVVANAALSGDSLDSGGEFDIQSLAVDKLLVAHSKNDSVLNKMYDAVDHWLEVLLASVIPDGLLNVTVDTKRDALGQFGYSGSSPRVSNWDMTRIWDEDHSGVYWSKDDGRLKSEPNQSEFWRPLSAKLRESGNACTA